VHGGGAGVCWGGICGEEGPGEDQEDAVVLHANFLVSVR
jgi:hypothetical protein